MCGIVGAIAQRNVAPILLEGLKRLEYRGYDSVGVAVLQQGELRRERGIGRVAELAEQCRSHQFAGMVGIGHTRWATHGAPSEANAHPHFSHDTVAVVHNGIIENHDALRRQLQAAGYRFDSATDTEVIVHLIHSLYCDGRDLLAATQAALLQLEGAYAIGILSQLEPGRLVCARKGSPLLLGLGIEENFFASDVSALLPVTQKVVYLEEGDIADVTLLRYQVYDQQGRAVVRAVHTSEQTAEASELGPYRHFMQKEIFEQPRAIADTLQGLGSHFAPGLFGNEAEAVFADIEAVTILACGTSYHSGCVARYWLESLAGLPCQVEIASEYRYRDSVPNPKALLITISQSGETADTLAALKHAQALGHAYTLAICNVPESALVRASRLHYLTHAGPEIGVASTKAFTTQLAALFILANTLAKVRGRLSSDDEAQRIQLLRELPTAVQATLAAEGQLSAWAADLEYDRNALFLGRNSLFPIAQEGALKLKEISYIHAEAYAAGELKHGPLALVDKDMPVIICAPSDALTDKLKSNVQEVAARGGRLYVLTDAKGDFAGMAGIKLIRLAIAPSLLAPLLFTVPLQLLSYHTAVKKGTDVDKPRNLAKSVTVE